MQDDLILGQEDSMRVDVVFKTAAPVDQATALRQFLYEPDDGHALALWFQRISRGAVAHDSIADLKNHLNAEIAAIDQQINEQVNAILHHPKFQQLESSWRGLWGLVDLAGHFSMTQVRVLDISWREITKDIERSPDAMQSRLFRLIYSEEFDMAGGQPYGVLLGDYQVSHKPYNGHPYDDVYTLQGLSQIAAASFAPFICSAAPQLFGLDDLESLGHPLDYDQLFQQKEYLRWRSLRESEDSRFLAITLPGFLIRKPYPEKSQPGLNFIEDTSSPDGSDYLWGNACYAFGSVLIREFGEAGWFAHIRGVPRDYYGGGLVTSWVPQDYPTDSADVANKILTPVLITDSIERELSDQGLMSLCHCHDTPFAAFHSCPSLHKAKKFKDKSATANARISAMLQQVLSASRFAHYIKVMIRDKVGQFITAKDCERFLQEWLNQYVSGRDDLKWEMLARYPLRGARVDVREQPGSAGAYYSTIYLRPHYSADHLVSELRLTTELAGMK
ncbi:type VI secretion system contractile sheath large subunit [Parendozoicomonas sp. Alg238-R29]|uniref:type VI secretion system contractile sheath large subunit n=1 Tax=Parendozoicomonas sp. Alg238-R29 TaxID=2993446 RepID=UPI00248F0674|nr:type VI secretion system contractile sheath large subunit [Parendozoicomonas sp. Alg238-R29]